MVGPKLGAGLKYTHTHKEMMCFSPHYIVEEIDI